MTRAPLHRVELALALALAAGALACGGGGGGAQTGPACAGACAEALRWEELGPRDEGGRVSALAVDPGDRLHVLVGTPAGAIWESHDGAASWTQVAPWLAEVPLSALALRPGNPDVILAGTGTVSDGGSVQGALGILRTTDGGLSWSSAGELLPPYVSSLLFWAEDPDRVLAGTETGVRVSTDGGATFTDRFTGDAVSALLRDPFDPEAVFAAGRDGLLRSPDRGETWAPLASWPLAASDAGGGVTALSASTTAPGLVYATVQALDASRQTTHGLLLRSTDGGATFAPVGAAPAFCPTAGSCGYAQALAVDPLDDHRLLLGGDQLYASGDAGATWSTLAAPGGVHALALDAAGGYAAGTFGVATLDAARTAAVLHDAGLAIAAVADLDVSDEAVPRLLVATGDTGTWLGTGQPPTWRQVFAAGEPAGPARFDPFVPARLYASRPFGALFRSDDGGATFAPITDGIDLTQTAAAAAPLEPSRAARDLVYTARSQVFRSADGGTTWAAFRPVGTPEVLCVAPSPLYPGRVYFSLAQGPTVYKADSIGTDILSPTADPTVRIQAIYPSPAAENVIYAAGTSTATQAGHVYKTHDFGATWQEITPPGLAAATSVVADPLGALYVGTAQGVWRSANDGFTWSPFSAGLLAAGITRLRVAGGYLYAATNGRGVFRWRIVGLVSIDSIPAGARLRVDGGEVAAPFLAAWPAGESHTVEPVLTQTADTHQTLVGWIDGGPATRTVTATAGNVTLTVAIRSRFLLTTRASPAAGGAVTVEPASADGFYDVGSFLAVIAAAAPDHRFSGWTGALSGSQEHLGFVVMDGPHDLAATFTPLETTLATVPAGLALTVDGTATATPATFQWAAGSVHALSAPAQLPGTSGDPTVLVFDHWSDLLPREHDFTMLRDTYTTDLTATFIPTVEALTVPGGGSHVLATPGADDAAREVALSLGAAATPGPDAIAVVSGTNDGVRTIELALVPAAPSAQVDAYVEVGADRVTRLVLANPNAADVVAQLYLRDPTGAPLAVNPASITVPAGGLAVQVLDPSSFAAPATAGLLSVTADPPILVAVQSSRTNLRTQTTKLDPILAAPFLAPDANVPVAPALQVLLREPTTHHRLALLNPGAAEATGALRLVDEAGAVLAPASGGPVTAYDLPAGGYALLDFTLAAGAAGGSALSTARVELSPAAGPAPRVQLLEERVGANAAELPAAVPPSRSGSLFTVPVDLGLRDSGLVLTNPTAAAVTATVTLAGTDGAVTASAARALPARAQVVLLASELFPGAASAQGSLTAATAAPVLGVGVLRSVNTRGEVLVTGFPAADGDPAPATARFPWLVDGDSWSTALWLFGAGPTGAVQVTTTGRDGAPLYLPMTWR